MLSFLTAAHAAVECPRSVQGHCLTAFSLFEGYPAKQVELAPASVPGPNGSYVNTWPLRSSVGLVAVCRYDAPPYHQIGLPLGLSFCRAEGDPGRCKLAAIDHREQRNKHRSGWSVPVDVVEVTVE